jgi:hypothetical protein
MVLFSRKHEPFLYADVMKDETVKSKEDRIMKKEVYLITKENISVERAFEGYFFVP